MSAELTDFPMYTGVGGAAVAAHVAGFRPVAFCESAEYPRKVLARHWPDVPCFESDEDVTANAFRELGIDVPTVLSGGPPCQGFSLAGKRLGAEDPRNRWPVMRRVAAELGPAWVVVENVPGFVPYAVGVVIPDLEALGYECLPPVVYPVSAFGAPHERYRCFVVAHAGEGRRGETQRDVQAWQHDVAGRSTVGVGLADANRAGRGELLRPLADGAEQPASEHDGGAVGDAFGSLRERRTDEPGRGPKGGTAPDGTGEAMGDPPRRGPRCRTASWPGGQPARAGEGARPRDAEPGLGGVPGRFAGWLDALRWPLPPGPDQHDWEPGRLTTERVERVARLKGLGNIAVPVQLVPIFLAIREAEKGR